MKLNYNSIDPKFKHFTSHVDYLINRIVGKLLSESDLLQIFSARMN